MSVVENREAAFRELAFDSIPGWAEDNHLHAFQAFLVSCRHMAKKPYKTKGLNIDGASLSRLAVKALASKVETAEQARRFFVASFTPVRIAGCNGDLLTGFFEPEVKASRKPDTIYRYPLLARPRDLVSLPDEGLVFDGARHRYARQTMSGLQPCFDRGEIERGAFDGQGLELAWLSDRVDAFFIHVQGAARLRMTDGSVMRVTYDGKSGHTYTSIGRLLAEQLSMNPADMTADRLADWMRANPDSLDDLIWQNRSYIFFREVEGQSPQEGQIAAAKTPLVAGRSLAIDRELYTFGTPIFVTTAEPLPGEAHPLRRLMVAQDTGSAIKGPERGDYFAGSGAEAGQLAGRIRHRVQFTVLMPRPEPRS